MGKKSRKNNHFFFNRKVDSLLVSRTWAIDERWGQQQLMKYVDQVDKISEGGEIASITLDQIKADRKSQSVRYVENIGDEFSDLENSKEGAIAILKVDGVMQMQDSLSHNGMESVCNDIRKCNASGSGIKAIVIEGNSGGGDPLAGQLLDNAIIDSTIPVVGYGHLVASAFVRGLAHADHIMLSGKSAMMGSVGSMTIVNKKAAEFQRDNYEDIYSKVSPDKNVEWREYLKGNKGPFIQSTTEGAIIFQNHIKEARNLNPAMEKETLSGGMFRGESAIERGLADSMGTLNDAIKLASNLAENKIQIKNSQNMNYKNAWMSLVVTLNSLFGTKFDNSETANPEDVNQGMDLNTQMENLKNSIVAEATKNMNSTLEALNAKVAKLEADNKKLAEGQQSTDEDLTKKVNELTTKVESQSTQISALTDQNTTLLTDKKDIEVQLATLQGKGDQGTGGEGGQEGNTAAGIGERTAVSKFNENLNALQEIDADVETEY